MVRIEPIVGNLFAAACTRMVWVRGMEQRAKPEWSVAGAATGGAGCGAILVMFHQAYHILSGSFHDSDPFVHIMLELSVASSAGALLGVMGAVLWHRRLQP